MYHFLTAPSAYPESLLLLMSIDNDTVKLLLEENATLREQIRQAEEMLAERQAEKNRLLEAYAKEEVKLFHKGYEVEKRRLYDQMKAAWTFSVEEEERNSSSAGR